MKVGTVRIIERFLWLPIRLLNKRTDKHESHWLIKVKIEQIYVEHIIDDYTSGSPGYVDYCYWQDQYFV